MSSHVSLAGSFRLHLQVAVLMVLALMSPALWATAQETHASTGPGAADVSPSPAGAGATSGLPDGVTRQDVVDRIDAVIADHDTTIDVAAVGLAVVAADGTVLHTVGVTDGMLPASTNKVVTAASVLATFELDDRIRTVVASTAPIGPGGVIDGDLVLIGGGDPTLTSQGYRRHIYPARPATAIEDLADKIVAAGVTRVTGELVGDGTRFGPLDTAAGWPSRYLSAYDARHIQAIGIDAGIDVAVTDSGTLAGQSHSQDPSLSAAMALAQALADRGVVPGSRVRATAFPISAPNTIAWVDSPPIGEILTFMLQNSDNHMADTLVRTAALDALGDGSWSAADHQARVALTDLGIDTEGLVIADGSGLSRLDRVSPTMLAQTDAALTRRHGTAWSRSLAVAGEAGTLSNRLRGTAVEGRLFAKTGTLRDVKALVGHVVDDDSDGTLHFALIGNDVREGNNWRLAVLGDDIALALADLLDR